MRDYRDAKTMAQTLRSALSEKSITLKQSESLEIIAKTLGVKDWNTLSAAIRTGGRSRIQRAAAKPSSAQPLRNQEILPALPLRDVVVFPKVVIPLFVGRVRSKRAFEKALADDGRVLLVTQKLSTDDEPGADSLYHIGVLADVLQCLDRPDGSLLLNVQSHCRARIEGFTGTTEFYTARATPVHEHLDDAAGATALSQQVIKE